MHSRNTYEKPRRVLASVARGPQPIGETESETKKKEEAEMRSILVGGSGGKRMPIMGYGCWKIARESTADCIVEAIRAGYRHIDSACDYGNEKEVGEGIRRAIEEVSGGVTYLVSSRAFRSNVDVLFGYRVS